MGSDYIICSAIHFQDGEKYVHQPKNIDLGYVICGRRHHNCFATRFIFRGDIKRDVSDFAIYVEGFLTSNDNFVTRQEAYEIAYLSGQLTGGYERGRSLFSEDLW